MIDPVNRETKDRNIQIHNLPEQRRDRRAKYLSQQ